MHSRRVRDYLARVLLDSRRVRDYLAWVLFAQISLQDGAWEPWPTLMTQYTDQATTAQICAAAKQGVLVVKDEDRDGKIFDKRVMIAMECERLALKEAAKAERLRVLAYLPTHRHHNAHQHGKERREECGGVHSHGRSLPLRKDSRLALDAICQSQVRAHGSCHSDGLDGELRGGCRI